MFDERVPGRDQSLWRPIDPPKPIRVDLASALPTKGRGFRADGIPLGIRAGGLSVSGRVDGVLHCWVRTTSGDWLGLAEFTLTSPNGQNRVEVRQWCPEHALSPREQW